MIKWGVRLIGFLFFFEALWDLYKLVIDKTNSKRFFLSGSISYDGNHVEILAWVGVCIFAYTGYHLFRLHSEGLTWALIVLWVRAFFSGFALIIFVILAIASHFSLKEMSLYLYIFDKSNKINSPITILMVIGLLFLFYYVQIYFLKM